MLPFELIYRDINSKEIPRENLNIFKKHSWILSLLPTLKLKAVELAQILVVMRNVTKQKDFIIQKAEKGNTAVILDKESYIEKMKELLSRTSKFKHLEVPLDKHLRVAINYQDKSKNILKNLHD